MKRNRFSLKHHSYLVVMCAKRCVLTTKIFQLRPSQNSNTIEPYINIDELETLTNKEFKAKYGHRAFSWRGKKNTNEKSRDYR